MTFPHRLAKLKAMSLPEVMHRLKYVGFCAGERAWVTTHGWTSRQTRPRSRARDVRSAPTAVITVAEALRANRPRFFPGVHDRLATRAALDTVNAGHLQATLAEADDALTNAISFFGQRFELPETINWHQDPVTNRVWPNVYHRDVPVHQGGAAYGDVKYVWELNRHQFLMDLGKAFFFTREARYKNKAIALQQSWLDGNRYGVGVNWASALEPAFRVFSWLWCYYLCSEDEASDPVDDLNWAAGFYDHGRFLYHHLERYESPFNHLAGEAAALYALGLLLRPLKEADRWQERGRELLEGQLADQFFPDGGSVEQSTFYHHATLGFYLLAAILGRRHGDELSSDVWRGIGRALEFSMALTQPDGRVPSIGGADDGKPIRLEHVPLWDFRPYLAIGAVLFKRADFKFVADHFWEDAVWLLGPTTLSTFDGLGAEAPPTSQVLPSSGYFVIRSDWDPRGDYVCFDAGPQAGGLRTDAVPSAAHGHADALSLVVWLAGRPVLVDPGFYCYNGDPDWEVHFRKTRAHSTVTIDECDQARHLAKMAWSHSYRAVLKAVDVPDGWAIGSHDGFERTIGPGIVHQRTIWLRPSGYLAVLDVIRGAEGHELGVVFQFARGVLRAIGEHAMLFEDHTEVVWTSSSPATADLRQGGPAPADGWIATSLGVREPAPRLQVQGTIGSSLMSCLTVLAARYDEHRRVERVDSTEGSVLRVRCDDVVELVSMRRDSSGMPGLTIDIEHQGRVVS